MLKRRHQIVDPPLATASSTSCFPAFSPHATSGLQDDLPLMAYASRTGTRRNLEALRAHGWGLFVSATGVLRTEGFSTYALDNGAWTAHRQGCPFDEGAFLAAVELLGAGAQFVVVPDIVCGGLGSLRLSEAWLPRLEGVGRRRLLAVQNGMVPADVRSLLCSDVGIFVGGDSAWKESTLPAWGDLAREIGCYLHVGRVNSARRVRLCQVAGAASFDGTSVSRFAKTIHRLDAARRQAVLPRSRGTRSDSSSSPPPPGGGQSRSRERSP